MLKNLFALILALISSIFGGGKLKNVDLKNQLTPAPTVIEVQTVTQAPTGSPIVPLPTSEDAIRTYFSLINEQRLDEAISMMTQNAVPNEAVKQGYKKSYEVFASLKITKIADSFKEEWTDDRQTYMVTFEAETTPQNELMPIPWNNGLNTRFVTVIKQGDIWKIDGLATGP